MNKSALHCITVTYNTLQYHITEQHIIVHYIKWHYITLQKRCSNACAGTYKYFVTAHGRSDVLYADVFPRLYRERAATVSYASQEVFQHDCPIVGEVDFWVELDAIESLLLIWNSCKHTQPRHKMHLKVVLFANCITKSKPTCY